MATLLDLLSPYAVLESLVSVLPLGDLFSLSRTNSMFRAALHGFELARPYGRMHLDAQARVTLCIGAHDTAFWRNLKSKSPILCSESNHTRGDKIRGCLMCSMPICEACIIKELFHKSDEKPFQHRTRSLCNVCYYSRTPHIEQKLQHGVKSNTPKRTCKCTAKDGYLCIRCMNEQGSNLETKLAQCYGQGCSKTQPGGFSEGICLWCDLRLPEGYIRAKAQRNYDVIHLLARSWSSLEGPKDDELNDRAKQEIIERMEAERLRVLRNVSERRETTAVWAEDERWRRAEDLRRSDSMFYPPPPIMRQRTHHVAEGSQRQRSDSTCSTLVEGDPSAPPSYGYGLFGDDSGAKGNQQ